MTALVCGSFAYDTIMVFSDKFKNHILPDKVHMLNVSFLVPDMRREFGGCAGNICYNLHLLGGDVKPMGTVGIDFSPYGNWFTDIGIDQQHITVVDNTFTAQAFITTDLDDNQITAFHPGAMSMSHQNKVTDASGVTLGIVSPDGKQGMTEHAEQFVNAGIPFVFDPGQGMPMFNGEELRQFLEQATWVTLNDYESQLMQERTGLSLKEMTQRVEALIVTKGGEGSVIYTQQSEVTIPVVKAQNVVDPTGCGDAYRSGLLYGLLNDCDWETTGRLASLMGSLKVACHGTQNHRPTRDEIKAAYRTAFNSDFPIL